MKHPIYVEPLSNLVRMMVARTKNQDELINIINEELDLGGANPENLIRLASTIQSIILGGHQVIKVSNLNDWQENVSRSSISKLLIGDFKLPFKGLAIDISNTPLFGSGSHFYIGVAFNKMTFVVIDQQKGSLFTTTQAYDVHISDWEHEFEPEYIDDVYKMFSICLYVTTFQKDKHRVIPKLVANKGSKKRGLPNHNTNVLTLKQPQYTLEGRTQSGTRLKSDKMWMVRGHWRNQPYGKIVENEERLTRLMFIDPHWRGEGSKNMMREVCI